MLNRLKTRWIASLLFATALAGLVITPLTTVLAAEDHAVEAEASHAADEHTAAEHGADEHGEAGHPAGPPLDFKRDLALWSGITFIVFVIVLKTFAWGPLVNGLDNRESRLRKEIADAEAANRKSQALLAEHQAKLEAAQQEISALLQQGRQDAERVRQEMLAATNKEADALRQRATEDIGRAKDGAIKELFDQMSAAVTQATEHVLGRALDGNDYDRLINESLEQFAEKSSK